MFCNKCGAKLAKDSNFCHICGNKIKDIEIYIKKDTQVSNQIEIRDLFKKEEAGFEEKTKKENNFLNTIKSFNLKGKENTPLAGDEEFASKLNEEIDISKTTSFQGSFKYNNFSQNIFINENEDFLLSISNTIKEETSVHPENEQKKTSVLKRFIDYMKEDEVYDSTILENNKSKKEKIELENKDVKEENFIPAEEVQKKLPSIKKNGKILSILNKFKIFMNEEDEDNLLDLLPDEYHEIIYGQGDLNEIIEEENKNKVLEFVNSLNVTEEINKLSPSEDSFKENDNVHDEENSSEPNYSYADNEQKIRYSKTTLDSYLNNHESVELKISDFDEIDSYIFDSKKYNPSKPIKDSKDIVEKIAPIIKKQDIEKFDNLFNSNHNQKIKEKSTGFIKTNVLNPICEFTNSFIQFFALSKKRKKKLKKTI